MSARSGSLANHGLLAYIKPCHQGDDVGPKKFDRKDLHSTRLLWHPQLRTFEDSSVLCRTAESGIVDQVMVSLNKDG